MTERKPNILFLLPDQHHADFLGINPELPLRTPNLDRLCERGTRFTNAFTPSPLCAPARACLASGHDYWQSGVLNNFQNYPLDQPTYYQRLRDRGYRVCGVGKFDLHKDTSNPKNMFWELDGSKNLNDWGFTEGIDNEGKFDGSTSYRKNNNEPRGPYLSYLKQHGLADIHAGEHANRTSDAYITALPDEAYCDNWLSGNGINFLRRFPKDQPWHLVVNFTGPHGPMDITGNMLESWHGKPLPEARGNHEDDQNDVNLKRRNYAIMVENIDRLIGRFIEEIDARGELGNTLIVFSSDHGEMLGEHSRWGKCLWYHASMRIPMIVAGPGIEQGKVTGSLVSLHDLCPTFLDYAGAEPLSGIGAKSMRPVLSGESSTHRSEVYSALRQRKDSCWDCLFDGRWKLIRANGETILYDLETDPYEDMNLSGKNLKAEAELMEKIRSINTGLHSKSNPAENES